MTVKLEPISVIITILALVFVVGPAMKKDAEKQKKDPVVQQAQQSKL